MAGCTELIPEDLKDCERNAFAVFFIAEEQKIDWIGLLSASRWFAKGMLFLMQFCYILSDELLSGGRSSMENKTLQDNQRG